ncbi:hypothetical protein ACFQ0T_00600 [Kitasatospora gansuensis]
MGVAAAYGESAGSRSVTPEPSRAPERIALRAVGPAGVSVQSSRPPARRVELMLRRFVPRGHPAGGE